MTTRKASTSPSFPPPTLPSQNMTDSTVDFDPVSSASSTSDSSLFVDSGAAPLSVQDLVDSAPASLVVPKAGKLEFLKEKGSPFKDGYSIGRERAFLADFIAAGMPEEAGPLFDRYVELEDREDQVASSQAKFRERNGAESAYVTMRESEAIDNLGALVDEDTDTMTFHTKEAHRMFMGRSKQLGVEAGPIIGGKRIAAALKSLWNMTREDNPHADWGLLRHEHSIVEVQEKMQIEHKKAETQLQDMQRRGMHLSPLKSSSPSIFKLGYRSPYGYAISELMVDFDYYVRIQMTLERKNVISKDQRRAAIAEMQRVIRKSFNETARFDRWLRMEELKHLSRADFLPGATPEAVARAAFANQYIDPIPADVYTGKLQPRHSRRTIKSTAQERQLLVKVAESWAVTPQANDAGLAAGAGEGAGTSASGDGSSSGGAGSAPASKPKALKRMRPQASIDAAAARDAGAIQGHSAAL
jgi:integrating conjugative element protein (TIGR03761 family)